MNKRGEEAGYTWREIMVAIIISLLIIAGLLYALRRLFTPYL